MTKAILLDIEGTTTPIDFVHKTLFPFARDRVESFVAENFDYLSAQIAQLAEEASNDDSYTGGFNADSAVSVSDYLKFLIDHDRKSTPLKTIQGMIWQDGYRSGSLVSTVYPDVPKAFERWKHRARTIAIYSSGSVLAQQLIFKYSDRGDLTPYIDNYFDTRIGHKRDPASYAAIANEMGIAGKDILFISDIPEELRAAAENGFEVVLSVRPGNPLVANPDGFRTTTDLDEIG